jgi:(E)-4-hydroxy-3-methylbut-2-enyl-diphosphate synthase
LRKTKPIQVGDLVIGGGAPVSVQSMTTTDTRNWQATLSQINSLAERGCQLVRVAVVDTQAAQALEKICTSSPVPVAADIHFDYRLALAALDSGIAKLRINPGNIGDENRVRQVVLKAKERSVPIRIGVNAGSLEAGILEKYGGVTAEGMVESALQKIRQLEELDFDQIVISLKASRLPLMLKANRLMAKSTSYPLHLGVTEAGTAYSGTIRSAVGLGILLAEGIGDTIRVSLAADPTEEVRAGYEILKSLELRERGPTLIACPTCGRCQIDLFGLVAQVERRLASLEEPLCVAVMGCAVNGPGEAREADVGIAGGRGMGLVFRKGEIVDRVPEAELVDALFREIAELKECKRDEDE